MSDLKKCHSCEKYTLKETCEKCNSKTISPQYKFKKVRDAPPRSAPRKKS